MDGSVATIHTEPLTHRALGPQADMFMPPGQRSLRTKTPTKRLIQHSRSSVMNEEPDAIGVNYSVVMWSQPWITGANFITTGVNTTLTIVISLMRMFNEGPLVSLHGSPTVSPMTPAL